MSANPHVNNAKSAILYWSRPILHTDLGQKILIRTYTDEDNFLISTTGSD